MYRPLPDGLTIPVELPPNISFPSIPAIDEIIADMPEFEINIDKDALKALGEEAKKAIEDAKEILEKQTPKYTPSIKDKLTLT